MCQNPEASRVGHPSIKILVYRSFVTLLPIRTRHFCLQQLRPLRRPSLNPVYPGPGTEGGVIEDVGVGKRWGIRKVRSVWFRTEVGIHSSKEGLGILLGVRPSYTDIDGFSFCFERTMSVHFISDLILGQWSWNNLQISSTFTHFYWLLCTLLISLFILCFVNFVSSYFKSLFTLLHC